MPGEGDGPSASIRETAKRLRGTPTGGREIAAAAMPAPAPRVFSTAGLPDAQRIELWERHNAAALIGLSCQTTGSHPFRAVELNVAAGRIDLARVAGSSHMVERTGDMIRRRPTDAVAVYLTLRGDAWFSHSDGTRVLRPGSVLICDADRPFARGFARGLEELVIRVPRAAFPEGASLNARRLPVISDFTAGSDPYARALTMLADRAARPEIAVPADESTILGLTTMLVTGRDTDPSIAHRAAARCFIEAHLTDRGLTASQVAAATGISERHLSRIFAGDGTTVPRHILLRRLQLAYAVLSRPEGAGSTVAEVAARCGFTSTTYFSRVFREHFGRHAGEIRRQAQASWRVPA
jgi:AraC-like DNA-binding protein